MKLLAIDTSMQACSAAIFDAVLGSLLAASSVAMERGHAEALAPMVQKVLASAGLKPNDLDRIAVTIGPGTFTGVRIGLAMARGMGLALGIPVIGIDSLTAIALNVTGKPGPLMVAADARLNEVYAALYDASGEIVLGPSVLTLDEAISHLPVGAVTIMGSAADALISASPRSDLVRGRDGDLPQASNFAANAAVLDGSGAMPSPLYLRGANAKPQAQPKRSRQLLVREATAYDAPLIAHMHAQCFERPWTSEDIARLMAMPGAISLIAEDGGGPQGFALLRRAADEAEILTIGTLPKARRNGIAKMLIDTRCAGLASEGIISLFIEVADANIAAQALYKSIGFAESGRRKAYYDLGDGRHEDAIIMRKILAP